MIGKSVLRMDRSEVAQRRTRPQLSPACSLMRTEREKHAALMLANVATIVGALNERDLTLISELIGGTLETGCKTMILGNGGSCSTASHMAADLTLLSHAARIRAPIIALHESPSIVSALANDHSFETSAATLIEAIASSGDLLLLFSCSGRSPNIMSAARCAAALGICTVLIGSQLAPPDFPADHFYWFHRRITQSSSLHILSLYTL